MSRLNTSLDFWNEICKHPEWFSDLSPTSGGTIHLVHAPIYEVMFVDIIVDGDISAHQSNSAPRRIRLHRRIQMESATRNLLHHQFLNNAVLSTDDHSIGSLMYGMDHTIDLDFAEIKD